MSEKRLLYIFDPLCSWCYGFSPVVSRLRDATRRRATWELLAGGMVVGERVAPIGQISDFLKRALPRVEQTTGIPFGAAFLTQVLEDGDLVLSPTEPSRALQAVKVLAPERAFAYGAALQRALYHEGRDITAFGVLSELAEAVDVPGFDIEYLKTSTWEATQAEFQFVSELGVTGFPTLVGLEGENSRVFSRGWAPYERVREAVDRWLDS